MTEAAGGGRAEIEGRIIRRSLEDEPFRRRLLEDPKAAVEEELETQLPESVEVRAVEETADTIYLVLPNASWLGEGGELSDLELEAVAGGYVNPRGSTSDQACGF
jgi:Nitrile hydratase, alpha chain